MKRVVSILALGVTFSLANVYKFDFKKVADGVECVIGDFNPPTKENKGFVNNACFVDVGDGLVVIDPGPSFEFAKEFAKATTKKSGKKIKAAIVTNYHDDRLYGASYYASKKIPVIAHKNIVDDIKKNPQKFERMKKILTKEEFANTKVVTPDILFDKEYDINGTKRVVKALKLSPVSEEKSDIVVWVPKSGFLFAGNIVFNNRALNYTTHSNMKGWIGAIDKIKALKPKVVLGGHGSIMGPDAYKTTLEYLQSLQSQVKKAYDSDVDLADSSKHIDMTKFKDLKHVEELNKHNASHYYNQLEWAE
jgi:glyoxylase-like metal-dependent hydrolase (beta-lactamase superfamily II)